MRLPKIFEIRARCGREFYVSDIDVPIIEAASGFRIVANDSRHGHHVVRSSDGARLHRLIMRPSISKLHVDHCDGNGLNCTRGNLRICTPRQNSWNSKIAAHPSSMYRGVRLCSLYADRPWVAAIKNGPMVIIGHFATEPGAAEAYDKACLELRGAFAWLNFPPIGWVQSGDATAFEDCLVIPHTS